MVSVFSVCTILLCAIVIIALVKAISRGYNDEVVVTTVTEEYDEPGFVVVGDLRRQWENNQPYVIDPVDGARCWLNTKDEYYEDAADKIWKLI